jgi:bacillithiol system protein YtxJ
MRPDLKALRYMTDLDQLLEESAGRPVLLFKHSYSCGTSAEALDELIAHLDEERRHDTRYAVVTVQTHRDISNAVSARLGVRHETPQALLIRDRRVVWSASHFRVTADAVARAIETHVATSHPAEPVPPR